MERAVAGGEPRFVLSFHLWPPRTVQRDADMIVLTDYSDQGTFVDDQRVDGSITLDLGQVVRLGTSGETIQVIACMEIDET